jgi:hypothetical protein
MPKTLEKPKRKGAKMLRDGQFIKEEPPKIGAHYLPTTQHKEFTEEERYTQMLLLGDSEPTETHISEVLLWVAVFFIIVNSFYIAFKGF